MTFIWGNGDWAGAVHTGTTIWFVDNENKSAKGYVASTRLPDSTKNMDIGGRLSEDGVREILKGLLSGTTYLSVHSSDPGNTGANEITTIPRKTILNSLWTIT